MSFFDWVGKKFKRTSESPAQIHEARTLGIQELKNELKLSQQRETDVSKNAGKLLDSIHAQVDELKKIVKKLEGTHVDPDVPFAKIGEAMRKQLINVMPLLFKTLKKPDQLDYQTLAGYNENLNKFFESIAKAAYGNRYVLHFFTDEMKTFAPTMHALEDNANQLKNILDEKKEVVEKYSALEAQLNAASNYASAKAKLDDLVEESIVSLRELDSEKHEDSAKLEKELNEAKKAEEQIAALQSSLRAKASDSLNPLQRLLKKYAHSAKAKNERILAEKYAADPVTALFESNNAQECRELLTRLRAFTGGTSEDSKHLNSLNAFETSLQSMLEECSLLDEKLRIAGEKTSAMKARKAQEQARITYRKSLLEEIEQRKAKVVEEQTKQEKLLAEIEEKASKLLRAQVKIS